MVKFVKIGNFLEKMVKIESFGGKMTSYVKIWGKWSNNFFSKISKNYFSQAYGHKFGLKCLERGEFGQNTLITKSFGRFNFRTLASSESLNVRNFWCPKDKTSES